MTLVAALRCDSCGHESNALMDRLYILERHPCAECAGLKRVVGVTGDRRLRNLRVAKERRAVNRPRQVLDGALESPS